MTSMHLDLTSLETYRNSCLAIAHERLRDFATMDEIAAAEDDLNVYDHLRDLDEPRNVVVLEETITEADIAKAHVAVEEGRIFWEHAAAGEATRLKMGTKYLINPARDLTLDRMAAALAEELPRPVSVEEIRLSLPADPGQLLSLDLGTRHMIQMTYDLIRLAEEAGLEPAKVLAKQKILVILNESSADAIISETAESKFYGLKRENYLFMIQPSFPGLTLENGRFSFHPASPRRLHNHGQLIMQETMDDQIFHLDDSGRRKYLKAADFAVILEESLDKKSYNIEDLDYLTSSFAWRSLALALKLGAQGINMVMEIVANNPERPQKGGMAAFDRALNRNVMIESFQLKGMANEDIHFLNKNVNHYTNPIVSWRAIKEYGLPMPIAVKDGYLYFQPVQGDVNFLVRTEFVRRQKLKSIRAWKSAATSVEAIKAMHAQDNQPGFRDFVCQFMGVC